MFMFAAPETVHLNPEPPPPQPTAEYASLGAVRDSIGALLRRVVDPADTAMHVSLAPVMFTYWYVADSTAGWAFHVVVTDTSDCPNASIEKGLVAAGWVPSYGYVADGADGGEIGYVSREYFCLIDARWDGGDDTDSTYIPAPGCEVTVTCVPRREGDEPR
jgi:hypothetical protein